jgi:Tol biopolymer transport system component
MTRLSLTLTLTLVLVMASSPAAQSGQADTLFAAAQHKETTEGDLRGAIALYRDVVSQAGLNRALAAQALLRMGESYRKLGDPEAPRIFTRIVQDYPDQRDAASAAQARLGPANVARRAGGAFADQSAVRTLWSGATLPGGYIVDVSPDSKLVAYVRESTDSALVVRDIATGVDRPLTTSSESPTPERGEYAVSAAFSRDGKHVAYNWRIQSREPGANRAKVVDELRVVDLTEPGTPAPRVVFRDENTQGYGISPYGWFPDGDRIVVQVGRGDERTRQLGYVSIRDRKLTGLRMLDWRAARGISLSPDGRFLAYDLPADERTGQRDIFVLSADGSRLNTAIGGPSRDRVVGWSPDGTRLIFTRDDLQLWAQPMANGLPQGPPSVIKASARGTQFTLSAAGDLFELATVDDRMFYRVQVDFATGRSQGPPAAVSTVLPAPSAFDWSPDGKSMAGLHGIAGDLVLSVHSIESGASHVISLPLSFFDNNNFGWMPGGRSLLARAADMSGRLGFYRIDVTDGKVTPFLVPPGGVNMTRPQLSADGSTLYYISGRGVPAGAGGLPDASGRSYFERDVATGRERPVVALNRANAAYGSVSPDGKYIGALGWSRMTNGRPTNDAAWIFSIISTADGTEREIFRAEAPVEFLAGPAVEWTPDSRFMVVRKVVGTSHEVWSIPVAGGQAQKLDLGVANYTGKQIRISPNGRELVVQAGTPAKQEFRIVEHFLPPATR